MNIKRETLTLNVSGFTYYDLFDSQKLQQLTELFFREVREKNSTLAEQFLKFRDSKGAGYSPIESSRLIVEMAPHVSAFVAKMFGVENEWNAAKLVANKEQIVLMFKREFFTRTVLKKFTAAQAAGLPLDSLDIQVNEIQSAFPNVPSTDPELQTASIVNEIIEHQKILISDSPTNGIQYFSALRVRLSAKPSVKEVLPNGSDVESLKKFSIDLLGVFEQWLATHYYKKTGTMAHWVTFKQPHKVDFSKLVEMQVLNSPVPNTNIGNSETYRHRDGFDLTEGRYSEREAMSEVDYCIICHEREKDSCSKGFPDKTGSKKNPLGYELKGCPLDQKISESHLVKSKGDDIGALAIITIDNPMCPGTGHRICNDCMKGCIYQKQDPVNIPQAETRILTDVLSLPWGFEIYSLLTRWNPLNIERPYALPYNDKKILVVGMGPAGYTLAHYFLNEGFGVVGIDGLKIEPLPDEIAHSNGQPFSPIKDVNTIFERLSERPLLGFGGVSEYGITVRWDKNFLTVIYLNLLRRAQFKIYDGIRFGGTLTIDDAWEMGFDHISFASGAGKPTFVSIKNNLVRGIRKASDFLMALQLTGAGKRDSIANLQVRLPAIIIGGGLTAIDTTTELMAYYPIQVTKVKQRYDNLCALQGKEATDAMFDKEETAILHEFLAHAAEIETERAKAASEN